MKKKTQKASKKNETTKTDMLGRPRSQELLSVYRALGRCTEEDRYFFQLNEIEEVVGELGHEDDDLISALGSLGWDEELVERTLSRLRKEQEQLFARSATARRAAIKHQKKDAEP